MKKSKLILHILFYCFIVTSCSDANDRPLSQLDNRQPTNSINVSQVRIGNQIWMARNLGVSKYRNGDVIPNVQNPTEWENLTTGAWCYYNNDSVNGTVYGKLYNWYAVNDPRGLAPNGWRVASKNDWATMIAFLGGETLAGGELKQVGLSYWVSPNQGATNNLGFTALPGGNRFYNGEFGNIGSSVAWWTTTQSVNNNMCYNYCIYNYNTAVNLFIARKINGLSVRCIKE